MNAKVKLLTIIILLVLLPTSLLGFAIYKYMGQSIIKIQEDSLLNIKEIASRYWLDFYDEKYYDILNSTHMEPFIKLLSNDQINDQDYIIWKDMARKIINEDAYLNIGEGTLINSKGRVILSYKQSEEGLMLNKTRMYNSIKYGEKKYMCIAIEENKSKKLELAVPIKDEKGNFIGIFKRTISLGGIERYINNLHEDSNVYIYLMNDEGMVIYNDDYRELDISYSDFQDVFHLDDFHSGLIKNGENEKVVHYTLNKTKLIGAYEYISDNDWIILVVMDEEKVLTQVAKVRNKILLFILHIGIAAVLAGIIISNIIIDPLENLNTSVKKIVAGDLTVRCKYYGRDKYKVLYDNINYLIDNLQRKEKELRISARVDGLTHLPNRNTLYEMLDTLMYKHKNQAVMVLDLDSSKALNDIFGYEIGDIILMEVGNVLRNLPQKYCYPSRLWGDTFLVFVTDWEIEKYPERIAETILNDVQNICFIDDIRVHLSISIGIEYLTNEKTDMKKLIKRAELAMNIAKDTGKNRYVVYSESNNSES